jgi:hypothetical protein
MKKAKIYKIYKIMAKEFEENKDYEKAGEHYMKAYQELNDFLIVNINNLSNDSIYEYKINLFTFLTRAKICFRNSSNICKTIECMNLSFMMDTSWTEYRSQLKKDMIQIFDDNENNLSLDDKLLCLKIILNVLTKSADIEYAKYVQKHKKLSSFDI